MRGVDDPVVRLPDGPRGLLILRQLGEEAVKTALDAEGFQLLRVGRLGLQAFPVEVEASKSSRRMIKLAPVVRRRRNRGGSLCVSPRET